jgi:hypothetical protein
MDLLTAPFEATRRRPATAVWRPLFTVSAAMLATVGMGRILVEQGGLLADVGLAFEGAGVHGGFVGQGLVIALGGRGAWGPTALRVAAALFAGFLLGRLTPWGGLALLAVPALLLHECRRHPLLSRMGALAPAGPGSLAIGFASGAFLGVHLLVTASLTFGYAISVASLAGYATALAYDVGANALSAEWLFRGALFSHWWRHWGFWGAAATATAMSLVRYLLDPALPLTAEARAGAIFYLAALGLASSVLRAWSGSLVPGYLASVVFFAAYRALVVW